MIINRLFVFLLRHLWRLVRWAALSVYHGIAVLYRRRQARLQASDWRPRTVYTGRWQLADVRSIRLSTSVNNLLSISSIQYNTASIRSSMATINPSTSNQR